MKWRFFLLLCLLLSFIAVTFFVVQKKNPAHIPIFSTHYAKLKQWLSQHPFRSAHRTPKQTHLLNSDQDHSIRFEFYTTLPNLKIKQVEPKIENKKPAPAIKFASTLTPDELEHLLKEKLYMVQFGIFSNSNSADRFQKKLARTGLKTLIVKFTSHQKTLYRVQQGPFGNLDEAKILQKKLQKKGIATILRPVTNA